MTLLSAIGGVFVYKYGARIVDFSILLTLGYVTAYCLILGFLMVRKPVPTWGRWSRKVAAGVVVVTVLGAVLAILLTPEETRVARLPAIEEWLSRLAAGGFPWSDEGTRPSGLPVLFAVAAPFHFAGNAGLLAAGGIAILGAVIMQRASDMRQIWLWLAALLLLPSTYYEILVRSELLFNMALIVGIITVAERKLEPRSRNVWFYAISLAIGLLLSTRMVVVIPLAIYLAYRFRYEVASGTWFVLIATITFGVSLLPFAIWDADAFVAFGPFSVQMLYFPAWLGGLFLVAAIILGVCSRRMSNIWFYSGVLQFVIVLISFLLTVAPEGMSLEVFRAAIVDDWFDISYFVFSVPFLILALRPRK